VCSLREGLRVDLTGLMRPAQQFHDIVGRCRKMLQMVDESFVFGRLFLGHEIPFVFVIR